MNVNESVYLCTTPPLSEQEVKLFKQRTRDMYQVNMILDNLPAMRFTNQNGVKIQWTGYPVGYTPPNSNDDYVINHLRFRVLIHEYEGAGVEIIGTGEEGMGVISEADNKKASGVKYDPDEMTKLHIYDNITSVNCPQELDKSQVIKEQDRVSFTYEVEFVKSSIRWPSRWDAYLKMEGARVHWFSILNSLMVQMRKCVAEFKKSSIAAGYVGTRMWRSIKGSSQGWGSVSWSIACFFPGIVFVILTLLNFLLWGSRSTGAIPISLYFILFSLWFCISVPLTLLGGLLGTKAQPIQYPVRTNQIPREIPARKYPSWLLVLGAGTLPFGTLFIELFFILSSIWLGRFYYVFGFLLIVFMLLVVVCVEVSVVLTYMHLCFEDWMWWWKAFFASGSVAVYVFLYSINYLIFDLQSLSGAVSATLYLGYSLIMAIAVMLSTGTIGLLASFYFVHYLFSSVKID
ncbi:UNVERIFIED_CONTAM: Transmembrane 9 superfamily member 12 [Sesamum angustifolium]|uniref:Transmembrane 9 superfamily member n=1 Tax=Sesamum angustifolium TaxID=2727405 RepID=A0AAW2INX8_9LAMI